MRCLVLLALSTLTTTQADMKVWLDSRAAGFSGAVLIARGDAIEVQAAYGMASAGNRNTPDTRFNVGSINKTFTALAIAHLIHQGRLSLDDPLTKCLPEYPNRDAAAKITIRDLITHRSGVAQFMRAEFGDATVEQMAKAVGSEPQVFEPRARQEYSNGGYIVLGRVIEVVSGQSYATYIGDHVYRPAGMTTGGLAGNPAGGGYFTANDLFRFARALKTGKLLDARMTDYVLNGTFSGDGAQKFGFALREQPIGARRFIGNGGGAPGVNAEFRFEPSGEYTVVVLANASPPAATQLLTDILNHLTPGGSASPLTPRQGTAPSQAASTPLRRELEALHAEMVAAFHERPADVARFYAKDARILGGGRRFIGDEVPSYWSQIPPGAAWTLEILDSGGSAGEPWLLGRSTLKKSGGPEMSTDYLAILRRGPDGRLRYLIDMFTIGVRPPG